MSWLLPVHHFLSVPFFHIGHVWISHFRVPVNMHLNIFFRNAHTKRDSPFQAFISTLLWPFLSASPYLTVRVLTNSSISLYLSLTHGLYQPGEHDGLLLKTWIRKQQKDKGCSERKERRNESTRTPVACYLITAVPACHAWLTGPLRSALAPSKAPSI